MINNGANFRLLGINKLYNKDNRIRISKGSNTSMSEYFLNVKISPNFSFNNSCSSIISKSEKGKKKEVSSCKSQEIKASEVINKKDIKYKRNRIANKSIDSTCIKLPKITNIRIDKNIDNETITMKNLRMFREIQIMHKRLTSNIFE